MLGSYKILVKTEIYLQDESRNRVCFVTQL
jgi:hypothetical protein